MGTRAATWAGQTPDSCERDEGRVEPTRAEARRLNVLAAASDLFATKGFEATSMRDIAAAVGLMSGSLCYHFASKEDLYVAVQDASVSKIYDSVRTAIDRPNEPWQRLVAVAPGALRGVAPPHRFPCPGHADFSARTRSVHSRQAGWACGTRRMDS